MPAFVLFALAAIPLQPAATYELGTARLEIAADATASLRFADAVWSSPQPLARLESARGTRYASAARREGARLTLDFGAGASAEFAVTTARGLAVFRLLRLEGAADATVLTLCSLNVPAGSTIAATINAATHAGNSVALMAAEPNVQAYYEGRSRFDADRPGCSHRVAQSKEAKVGRGALRFTATADAKPGGWAMQGRGLLRPLDLTGSSELRAWIHGDGKGQQLKIQLSNGRGGYRDYYAKIDFHGWRSVSFGKPPLDTLRPPRATSIAFYYNSLPAGQTVECLVDQVQAVVEVDGRSETVVIEDFEAADSPLWWPAGGMLGLRTVAAHGIRPAAFGILAAPAAELLPTIERFEAAAGLPSPKLAGVWNKVSPAVKRSYFFLTGFKEDDFDKALAIARRGGFSHILLVQSSWAKGTGHYQINRDAFADGLEGLRRTLARFKAAGFGVGLHFLAPSVYPPDPYITPRPDPRLVKGARVALAAEIDDKADFLPTVAAPGEFPDEDGGYKGRGAVLQVGDEIIAYGKRHDAPPYGFGGLRRGLYGTRAARHAKGAEAAHLVRSYGYHLFDIDTTLLDEVAEHFGRVANACDLDMVYFDGSELLQGDHWYYNARLHKAFYDQLKKKDVLLQASSTSHYSWHLLARSASADGHGDLKGYLDERSPGFRWMEKNHQPLDIGWYYGYDVNCPLDMYEYVLGATIGYGASMSFQTSPAAAEAHPFTLPILDLIARYERLRLSGRVPAEMAARLQIEAALGGVKDDAERRRVSALRREYRLVGDEGREAFQRVVYGDWQECPPGAPTRWSFDVKDAPARIGVELQAQPGPWVEAGPAYRDPAAVLLESGDDDAGYRTGAGGLRGGTLADVAQTLTVTKEAKEGGGALLYEATSRLGHPGGWSYCARSFAKPVDISWHRALGLWMRGDGGGGQFKLQLRDGKGAADYYLRNDYTGWRYHQLPRPEKDAIDYGRLSSLGLYYNSLPAATTVRCAIDGIKAQRAIDGKRLVDPAIAIGPWRWQWRGEVAEGQFVVFWPGEPIRRFGRPLAEPESLAARAVEAVAQPGAYTAEFTAKENIGTSVRARVTIQPPERHAIP